VTDHLDQLFERYRQGDGPETLGRVFDATAPRLLQLAIHLVGDISAAEDLVQATFVTAIERASTFDPSRKLEAWLAGILANHARDLKKSARRQIDVASIAERVESTPLEHALRTEWSSALAQAIDRVAEPYRVVLILRLQHGMTPAEIAHALQRSTGAVRVQLHRGREMLRKLLPAGILASAVFIAEPNRGLAQVRAKILAEAVLAKSSVGGAAIVGGLLMSTKLLVGVAALALALFAFFLMRSQSPEASSVATATGPQPAKLASDAKARDELAPIHAPEGPARVDASGSEPPKSETIVKLHGRVVDADSNEGIAGAEVDLFGAHAQRLSEVRRRWHDRFEVYEDGRVDAVAWPRFGAKLSDAALLDLETVTAYEPPSADDRPIAKATTDASGEFEIRAPESLGFLVCSASGYATRQKALSPAEVTRGPGNEASVQLMLRAPKPLAGYVVDESMQRIERRVRLAFVGHVNKPDPVSSNGGGSGLGGKPEAELQMDEWIVETKPDGSFECAIPAKMVYARSLEPDLGTVKQGFLRDGGTRWVHDVWSEPGTLTEPLVIVLKPVGSLLVRDRESHAPIEDVYLQCCSAGDGDVLRHGRFFAPEGRLRLASDWGVQEGMLAKERETKPCLCTVWSEGYVPLTKSVESLIAGKVTEFDLERGDGPAVSGRIHDGERAVENARISLSILWWRGTWSSSIRIPIAMATSDVDGHFRIAAPAGRYVLTIVSGDAEDSRVVELPLAAPIDVDLSVDTAIVASVHDASGAACTDHPVVLRGADGRWEKSKTDTNGLARFQRLAAGTYRIQVMNLPTASAFGVVHADQESSIDLRGGEEKHADFVIGAGPPRFARVVVEGCASFTGWKASKSPGHQVEWVDIDANGRVPIDIRSLRFLRIAAPEGGEWGARLPEDATDGYEIRLRLDGLGYEGILTSQATGEPLRGIRVIASPRNAPIGTGTVTTVVTDGEGRFRITGLSDDAYSMRFEDSLLGDEQMIYVQPTGKPTTPPAHLAIELPKRTGGAYESYGGHGYEGFREMTVTGVIRKDSGSTRDIQGFIGSVITRTGYELRLYVEFVAGPDGTYEAHVPVALRFAATLSNSATGEYFQEIVWDSTAVNGRELHDIDLP
jgi:RNA polymerase sigma-70 factor (ECF subfamily)